MEKKIGDKVDIGDTLAYIHANRENIEEAKQMVEVAYKISKERPEEYKDILDII